MSPSEPPTRISDPSVSRYAFTTHCCPARPPPRSSSIAGSATLTIVASSSAIPDPRIVATSAIWRRRPGVMRGVYPIEGSGGRGCGADASCALSERRPLLTVVVLAALLAAAAASAYAVSAVHARDAQVAALRRE